MNQAAHWFLFAVENDPHSRCGHGDQRCIVVSFTCPQRCKDTATGSCWRYRVLGWSFSVLVLNQSLSSIRLAAWCSRMDAAIGRSSAHIGVDATAGNAARRAVVSSLAIKVGLLQDGGCDPCSNGLQGLIDDQEHTRGMTEAAVTPCVDTWPNRPPTPNHDHMRLTEPGSGERRLGISTVGPEDSKHITRSPKACATHSG